MKAYRCIFALAAVYNTAFGIWAGFFPYSFFDLFGLPHPLYPSIWSCLGMVVGVYAIAYAYAAYKPEQSSLLIGIGLLGKLLGPIGWLVTMSKGELPSRTFLLILANDLIWWFPFLLYLLRDLPNRRTIIAWVGVLIHIAACCLLLASSGGTEITEGISNRMEWVASNRPLWTTTWVFWALASMSLLGFFVVWSARLLELKVSRTWVFCGCLTCALGVCCDLPGETVNIAWLTEKTISLADFAWGARVYAMLSAGIANGLYCIGGLLLSLLSWRAGWLRGGVGLLGMVMWIIGLIMTGMVFLSQDRGMIATGAAVMALYIPWAALVGWRLREPS